MAHDEVLARNERFLVEIVEAFSLCPFARATRLGGQLAREVVEVDEAGERARAYDEHAAQIVLLIVPTFTGDAKAFERWVDELRRTDELTRPPPFAMAPFHPDTAYATDTPSRLVGLFRRSPDPTIQLVRHSAIAAAKRHAPDGKFFFDGSAASWATLTARPERGLSEQIAHDNFARIAPRADELATKLRALRG